MNFYAQEKIKELEEQRQKALAGRPSTLQTARSKPVFGPLAAVLGGTLRRVGEGLESWANPSNRDPERPFRFDRY